MASADIGEVNTGQLPIDIWKNYPGLTESKLFHEFLCRLSAERDMHVIITASAETGVGKTTLAFAIALLWDIHGWQAEKATLSPYEYDVMYDQVPPGTVLLLDEVEQAADTRRATSSSNVDLSQAFAGKRYRQVFGLMTAPSKGWVDDRIGSDSADYWIQAQETPEGRPKGEAKVYRLKRNEHYESSYKKRTETITWPVLDWHPEYKRLDAKKAEWFEGQTERKYVHREEVEDLKTNYWNKCSKKSRFHYVRAMQKFGLTQSDIAEVLSLAESDSNGDLEALSQPRISDLVNAGEFSEVYSG